MAQVSMLDLQRAEERLVDRADGNRCGEEALRTLSRPSPTCFDIGRIVAPQHLEIG